MEKLVQLALAFAQVGIGAFGGGLSVLPLIEHQFVTRMGWLSPSDFSQLVALVQIAPGPIAVNAATLVGYQHGGFVGSLVATISLVAAPLLFVTLVLAALGRASADKTVLFQRTIAPIVAALLTLALIPPIRATVESGPWAITLFVVCIPLITKVSLFKKYPILLFILGGCLALVLPG